MARRDEEKQITEFVARGQRAQEAVNETIRRAGLPVSERMATHAARLTQATMLVRQVLDDLDTSAKECTHCGLTKATSWGERQAADSLGSIIRRLERCIREATKGYPTKRDGLAENGSEEGPA